ncbi:RHS repeat-associated core domain-containing protein [Lentisphaerota bacterium WC36G]|nr:RHS repeat-associated core domain-containing protein [Lentisphaerae bacterium WC36]
MEKSLKNDYTPFGQLAKTDENVENVFKFSSEYAEKETGLIYYNYRYYNPSTGKWLSRDPIEEDGGENIYGIVDNKPLNNIDKLGQKTSTAAVNPQLVEKIIRAILAGGAAVYSWLIAVACDVGETIIDEYEARCSKYCTNGCRYWRVTGTQKIKKTYKCVSVWWIPGHKKGWTKLRKTEKTPCEAECGNPPRKESPIYSPNSGPFT